MAVIKADAYGHGDTVTAGILNGTGCTDFAVSNIDEAISLRKAGVKGQILILGYTPSKACGELIRYDITQTVYSEEIAHSFYGKGIKAHIAVDTGMNRIGFDSSDPEKCAYTISSVCKGFNTTGIFTHLCTADTKEGLDFAKIQIGRFKNVLEQMPGLKFEYVHCMNSAGGVMLEPFGSLVRLGVIMYGLKPDISFELPEGIRPALSWKSVVSMVKTIKAGETIGYGRTYTAPNDMTVATIPTGYADGYFRSLSNKGKVMINGHPAPITGLVCMDQMMADVSGIPDVRPDDEVMLIGSGYTANDMAADAGTIGYEIICSISKRVPKLYI